MTVGIFYSESSPLGFLHMQSIQMILDCERLLLVWPVYVRQVEVQRSDLI